METTLVRTYSEDLLIRLELVKSAGSVQGMHSLGSVLVVSTKRLDAGYLYSHPGRTMAGKG